MGKQEYRQVGQNFLHEVVNLFTSVNDTAKLYSEQIIKGWENLYREKRKRLYEVLAKFYVGINALELGCGDGESTKQILTKFSTLDVVDASLEQLIAIQKQFPSINIFHSFFEDFEPSKKYDTIFMTHILEHLDNPEMVLQKACSCLTPDGVILISVPNALSFHRLVGVKMGLLSTPYSLNNQDILLGHRRVYDKAAMENLISMAPLSIKSFTGLMLKPISNRQIEESWSPDLIDAFFKLGFDFPEFCSEIIFVAGRKND